MFNNYRKSIIIKDHIKNRHIIVGDYSYYSGYYHGKSFEVGVFLGSLLWWLILSEGVTLFRKKVSQRVMMGINRLAGLMIAGFGIAAWCSV